MDGQSAPADYSVQATYVIWTAVIELLSQRSDYAQSWTSDAPLRSQTDHILNFQEST
tara:strand:- start:690 stop:860 length:171 start_codon:yes stop_codon:yes gene_type:complete